MSPRPRKVSDDEVFVATQRAMMRLTPAQLTLAEIAREAGLTAGALVQRFGSKRALLLALMERFAGETPAMFEAMRRSAPSPLEALRAYGDGMSRMAATPAMLAHHLSYLQVDFTDEDFHRYARAQAVAAQVSLREIAQDAIDAGELRADSDPALVARLVQVIVGGSMLAWGFFREGKARAWVREDLDAVLGPYLEVTGDR